MRKTTWEILQMSSFQSRRRRCLLAALFFDSSHLTDCRREEKTQKINFSLQIIQFFINRPKRERSTDERSFRPLENWYTLSDNFALIYRTTAWCFTIFYFTFHSSLSLTHPSDDWRWGNFWLKIMQQKRTVVCWRVSSCGQWCGIALKLSNNLLSFSFTESFRWIIADNCRPKSKSIISWVGGSERGDCGSSQPNINIICVLWGESWCYWKKNWLFTCAYTAQQPHTFNILS